MDFEKQIRETEKTMRRTCSKRFSLIYALMLCIVILFAACEINEHKVIPTKNKAYVKTISTGARDSSVGVFCEPGAGRVVEQTLTFDESVCIKDVSFAFGTYGHDDTSLCIDVSLLEDSGRKITSKAVELSELVDNDYVTIQFNGNTVLAQQYILRIEISDASSAVLLWGKPLATALAQTNVTVDTVATNYYLDASVTYDGGAAIVGIYWMLVATALAMVISGWLLITKSGPVSLRWTVLAVASAAGSLVMTIAYTAQVNGTSLLDFHTWSNGVMEIMQPVMIDRFAIFFVLLAFVGLHCIVNIKAMYRTIWKYRYLVAVALLVLLVVFKVHGSSIGMYDYYVGNADGSYSQPIFNHAQAIRSDEWARITANRIARAQENDSVFSTNYDAPVLSNSSAASYDVYVGWGNISNPFRFLYLLLGAEYGQSLIWCGTLIGSFMAVMEWFYIFTRKNKLLGFSGACVVIFSSFFQWWSYNPTWIYTLCGILSMIWYFFEYKITWKRVMLVAGIAMLGAEFVMEMYPAWMVPSAYVFLVLLLWVFYQKRKELRQLGKKEVLIIAGGIIFALSIIGTTLYVDRDYFISVTQTTYPGQRRYSSGGGLQYLLGAMQIQYLAHELHNMPNPCEFSGMLSLFPLPFIIAVVGSGWRLWKKKKQNGLQLSLCTITVVYFIIIAIGVPEWFMNITLLSYSTATRMTSVFMWVQVMLLFAVLSDKELMGKRPIWIAVAVGIAMCILAYKTLKPYIETAQLNTETAAIIMWSGVFALVGLLCMLVVRGTDKANRVLCAIVSLYCATTAATVHPVMRGLDAVYERPLAKAVQSLTANEPESVWITVDSLFPVGSFLRMCGANSICGSQPITNIEYWHQLDPEGKYESEYNRWSYLWMHFTDEETYFEGNADTIVVHLNPADLEVFGIQYVHALSQKQELENWDLVYQGDGGFIYRHPSE